MLFINCGVIASANTAPKKPILVGITSGKINTVYNFTAFSFDPDGDKIKYAFNFDDGTDPVFSEYLLSGTSFTIQHNWSSPGIYKIRVSVKDENNAFSDFTELTVFINTQFCGYLGYFIDTNNDGIYDDFVSNSSKNTSLEHFDIYLIDIDNDGTYDYKYNMTTGVIKSFNTDTDNGRVSSGFSYDFLIPLSFLCILVFVASLFIVLTFKNNKYGRRKKEEYVVDFEKKKDEPTRVVEKPVFVDSIKKDFDNIVFEKEFKNEKSIIIIEFERYIDSLFGN